MWVAFLTKYLHISNYFVRSHGVLFLCLKCKRLKADCQPFTRKSFKNYTAMQLYLISKPEVRVWCCDLISFLTKKKKSILLDAKRSWALKVVFLSHHSTWSASWTRHLQWVMCPEGRAGAVQGHKGQILLQCRLRTLWTLWIWRLWGKPEQFWDFGRMRGNMPRLGWV